MTEDTLMNTISQNISPPTSSTKPKLFKGSGRIGRLYFLLFFNLTFLLPLVPMLLLIPAMLMQQAEGTILLFFVSFAIALFVMVLNIILCIRRLNDFDAKGWWILVSLLPIFNILFMLALVFIPGTDGENRYGEQPAGPSDSVKAVIIALALIGIAIVFISFMSVSSSNYYY